MMKHEFEALAGYEVTNEDYDNVIEPMYMATNLSKQEFVKCIDRKRFALRTKAQLVASMKKEAKHLLETCEHYTDFESRDRLYATAKEYIDRFWSGCNYIVRTETVGTRFWNAPGRGCSFPEALVVFDDAGRTMKEIALA